MVERQEALGQIHPVNSAEKPQEPSLQESLSGRKISDRQMFALGIIDSMTININDKRLLFFYHLWHETGSMAPIKEFGEIREDPSVLSMLNKVMASDELVESYGTFYEKFSEEEHKYPEARTKKRRLSKKSVSLPKQDISIETIPEEKKEPKADNFSLQLTEEEVIQQIKPKGRHNARKAAEKLGTIMPFRGKLNSAEIAEQTGLSRDYVYGAFKRQVRRGRLKPVDKREVIERTPKYKIYLEIRSGIEKLVKSGQKYTDKEMANILSAELNQEITIQQIKRQKRLLIRDGKIQRRINQFR